MMTFSEHVISRDVLSRSEGIKISANVECEFTLALKLAPVFPSFHCFFFAFSICFHRPADLIFLFYLKTVVLQHKDLNRGHLRVFNQSQHKVEV